jgi:chlorite dismutase
MVTREPPQTDEGWYAFHDLRSIDWAAWRDAPEHVRQRALEEAVDFLQASEQVTDADDGDSALYTILGHKADLMVVHLRPTLADLDALERRFETTEFARFTEQTSSFVSVTEASGYSERAREYFDGEVDDDSGLAQYIRDRLHPSIPDDEYVSFYPMSKRRAPQQNWYDLPFEERAEHMESHGDIGRGYAGKVQQMITGAVGLDDWEWGVTLWADDMTDVKDLLYEMRFDPSSSKYAEFGPFYTGRRVAPGDLDAVLAGEDVPSGEGESPPATQTTETAEASVAGDDAHETTSGDESTEDAAESAGGAPAEAREQGADAVETVDDMPRRLSRFGVSSDDYDDGDYGLVFYAEADAEALVDEIDGLRGNFDHYDTHVMTSVRADQGEAAIVSIWANERAATTAAGFLSDVDGVTHGVGSALGDAGADDAGTEDASDDADDIRGELADRDIYAGKPHGEDVYALVLYSEADPADLHAEVDDLRDGFDRYDTHQGTSVYADPDSDTTAVVSLWDTQSAADKAANFLSDLPGIVGRPEDRDGFGTMGMFYTVKADHREEFTEKFDTVGDLLADMDGHRETALLVNHEDENDMFIASQWDAKDDAMAFFRSDAFRDTVEWGRDVLADRPRHVFLA